MHDISPARFPSQSPMTSTPSVAPFLSNHLRSMNSVHAAETWSAWSGHLLLFLICFATTFNVTLSNSDPKFETDSLVLIRLVICGACGLYGAWYLASTFSRLMTFPSTLYILFVAWSLLSVSQAESKTYSLAAVVTLICVVVFVPAALLQLGAKPFLFTTLVSLTSFAFFSWILYFVLPEIGAYQEAGGNNSRLGGDANQLGLQCALGLTVTGAMWLKRWLPTWAMALLVLFFSVTLIATDSRTSMACALCGTGFLGYRWLDWAGRFCIGATLACIATVMLITSPPDATRIAQESARSGDMLEIYSFNGRTEIWSYALQQSQNSLLLGHGYGASRFALSEYTNAGYDYDELHHAHNQIINALLTTGMLGALIVVCMGITQLYLAWKHPSLFPDSICIVIIFAGLLEVILFGPMPRVAVILWFAAIHWRNTEGNDENETRQPWPTSSDSVTASTQRTEAISIDDASDRTVPAEELA